MSDSARRTRLFALLVLAWVTGPLWGCSNSGPGGPEPRDDPVFDGSSGSGGVNQPVQLSKPYVVMLSLDGFRHDYLDLFSTPNLDRIADAGVRADGLIPVFPVKTFPNHYSIATGMYADGHGLVGNRFYDPLRDEIYSIGDRTTVEDGSWYGGEPIWVTAERQGMVSASFFWVGSEAPVAGIHPTHWRRFDGQIEYEDRVDQVLQWLALPELQRPHMITFYFEETDAVGHNYPTDSPELAAAVATVDGLIGRLLDGIEALPHASQVYVFVVSDHGMAPFLAEQTYFLGDLIDLGPDVQTIEAGPHMVLYTQGDEAADRELRDRLAELLPRAAVYRVGEMPAHLHYERAGPRLGNLVIVPDQGWSVVPWREADRAARDGWTHGWDPRNEVMHGLFVGRGPRIAPGQRIGRFESIHVYPLVAEVLGLQPSAGIDGRLEVLGAVLGN